jgi:hypothetical protein
LDASGKVTPVEDEADVFKIKFTMDGKEYGDVFATVDDERRLILYYGDDVGDSPESPTPNLGYNDTWLGFVEDLKSWKTRNGFKGWQLKNQDQLAPDMARRNHMKKKDKLGEGYYPMGKKASYSDAIPTIKMVIQHSRQIEEGEKRYRNISKIFLENLEGERFLAPTIKPGIARVYARHIAEGGKPHDDRWNHIGSLCEEYQKMAGFVRATRGQQFNESTQKLVESGIQHYQSLRESLSRMTGHRGYNSYFDSWSPPLMEDDADTSVVNELFVQETLDPRIESVMPILSKLHKTVAEMKEVDQLAKWADSLVEFAQHDHNDDGDDGEDEDSSHLDFLYSRKFDLESELDYADEEDKEHIQSELDDINDEIESLGGLSEDDGMQSNNPVAIPEEDEANPKSHQAQTTLKHLKTASYGDKADAALIKPGIAGYLDRIDVLKRHKALGNLNDIDENFISMSPQAVAEGLDDEQRQRLDTLIDQYSDSVDPEAYYGLDDEYPDSDEVIAQIRQEFGDKIADTVEAGASKMHFPRDNHSFGNDPLKGKMSPRVNKSGTINKQDNDYMKREIKRRMNYTSGGPKGVLPEDEISTHKGGTVTSKDGVTKHKSGPGVYGGYDASKHPDSPEEKHSEPRGRKTGHSTDQINKFKFSEGQEDLDTIKRLLGK